MNYDSARGLVDEEEMEMMKEKIISYIEAGNVLERTCPGCGKELSKPKNLGKPPTIISPSFIILCQIKGYYGSLKGTRISTKA